MTIQELGSLGELLAAIATLATLVYLARQIRQNTSFARSANFGTWIEAINRANDTLIEISDFARDALAKSRPLSESETIRFFAYCGQVLNAGEAFFLFHQDGTVDDQYFLSKMAAVRALLATPGGRELWESTFNEALDPRFVAYVTEEILPQSPQVPDFLGEPAA